MWSNDFLSLWGNLYRFCKLSRPDCTQPNEKVRWRYYYSGINIIKIRKEKITSRPYKRSDNGILIHIVYYKSWRVITILGLIEIQKSAKEIKDDLMTFSSGNILFSVSLKLLILCFIIYFKHTIINWQGQVWCTVFKEIHQEGLYTFGW